MSTPGMIVCRERTWRDDLAQNLPTSSCHLRHLMDGWMKESDVHYLDNKYLRPLLPGACPCPCLAISCLGKNVHYTTPLLQFNKRIKLSSSFLKKSNQGLSPFLPGSAGWGLLSHSRIQWPPGKSWVTWQLELFRDVHWTLFRCISNLFNQQHNRSALKIYIQPCLYRNTTNA